MSQYRIYYQNNLVSHRHTSVIEFVSTRTWRVLIVKTFMKYTRTQNVLKDVYIITRTLVKYDLFYIKKCVKHIYVWNVLWSIVTVTLITDYLQLIKLLESLIVKVILEDKELYIEINTDTRLLMKTSQGWMFIRPSVCLDVCPSIRPSIWLPSFSLLKRKAWSLRWTTNLITILMLHSSNLVWSNMGS